MSENMRLIRMDEELDIEEEPCSPSECANAFVHSFGHSLVQGPIDGVTEVVNTVAGKQVIPKVEVVKRPERAEFGKAKWQAQQVGSGAGIVACLMVVAGLLSRRR
ncbi:MAG: hypothetical protein IAF58_21590 [Leptolyngbya sp.]|nr:hypothetical protein [Candidatus Melainabacteria bacterium]